ncbi:MAG: cupin domain-containing protein [Nitrososphaeria archaeon]
MSDMKVFGYREVESRKAEEGAEGLSVRWLITKEMGAENFAMRLFEMDPKGFSPRHSHPWEHEVFVLEGEGVVYGGGEERRFRTGDVIFIPPNEEHQLKNTGRKMVKFLCLIPYTKME